jgi:hypothetical protein
MASAYAAGDDVQLWKGVVSVGGQRASLQGGCVRASSAEPNR